ncbi:VOC family protein [Solirubrobacter phytolaccae]|uniref:VOC family protein n=1 Tax=Solirubrobacter phytolaccae TaxID=1404360 RepID=A0A9X3NII0_9ACTN|nr:VOC family protein [Solirubrobacter phytolaccae]MDA0185737.1 VOC family protein [Solirubrobacter phytolaccae]
MLQGIGRMVVGVSDQDEALAFYRDVLGFIVLHDSDEEGLRYLHMGVPGQPDTGIWLMPGAAEHDRPLLVLFADDLTDISESLERHGVDTWGTSATSLHFRDCCGNVLVAAVEP